MSIRVLTFFNNKGGVGKTSLVYHLAWMYADLGVKVVAADLDPQANLTSMFLDEDYLEPFGWKVDNGGRSMALSSLSWKEQEILSHLTLKDPKSACPSLWETSNCPLPRMSCRANGRDA